MPAFSWLEPNYFDGENYAASDQHPDHDVSIGDQLIKDVYDAVRASPLWEKTALIITYDEHGGFFDHVSPPEGVPNPDGINSTDDPFDFTRLGMYSHFFFASLIGVGVFQCLYYTYCSPFYHTYAVLNVPN